MRILDIDLDFFLNLKANERVTCKRRLNKKNYKCWDSEDVRSFLENNCGLSKTKRVRGKCFIHHVEVFYFLKQLQQKRDFPLKFHIDHVDAHADLGLMDSSYEYISTKLLHQPVEDRAEVKKKNGNYGLSSGNYLAYLIACQWIEELNYINQHKWFDDIPRFHLQNFDKDSNFIQLKKYTKDNIRSMVSRGDFFETALRIAPLDLEPQVQFNRIDFQNFQNRENYDYILLTQSPGFTPQTADNLMDIIREYMELDL